MDYNDTPKKGIKMETSKKDHNNEMFDRFKETHYPGRTDEEIKSTVKRTLIVNVVLMASASIAGHILVKILEKKTEPNS